MIPIPISLGDIIKICKFLHGIVLDCINATKEQTGLRRTFEILQGKIEHYIRYMHDYILAPDQLGLWHTALAGCEVHVSQLHKNLRAGSSSHLTVIKRAMYVLSWKRDLKLAADLQKEIENLASVYELICRKAPEVSRVRKVLARP